MRRIPQLRLWLLVLLAVLAVCLLAHGAHGTDAAALMLVPFALVLVFPGEIVSVLQLRLVPAGLVEVGEPLATALHALYQRPPPVRS